MRAMACTTTQFGFHAGGTSYTPAAKTEGVSDQGGGAGTFGINLQQLLQSVVEAHECHLDAHLWPALRMLPGLLLVLISLLQREGTDLD